ncbi:MAG: hypothetical protein CVV02_15225 [Firmicutes bacterium HGW-Firmicutes-7]|nr:MAG: hypothetical protein CVV02_15225 [Firmicutes bacterium HGW-Firmicutes-7]
MQKKNTNTINREFALEVAQEAVKLYKQQEEKTEKKTVFRNTRVLLKHYNDLKEHCGNALDDLCNDVYMLGIGELVEALQENIIIESIVRTKSRTYVMVRHIDSCISVIQNSMIQAGTPEKFEVLNILYLDPNSCKLPRGDKIIIASEKLNISERTADRYELDMIQEMSVLLFGIGATKLIK